MKAWNNTVRLITSIVIVQLAGIIGAVFTTPAIGTWYATLVQPDLVPPNWIFGPVWTTLYLFMGIALYLIWSKGLDRKDVQSALTIFAIQLVLNTAWSIIFFGLKNPGAAFLELVILWIAIAATIVAFHKLSKPAAYLLVPYILWVSFAGYLNYSIWQLNREVIGDGAVACTQDAKQCPDGSYVGRSGPNCEFTACPGE